VLLFSRLSLAILAEVVSVEWVAFSGNDALDGDPNNRGSRIFRGKRSPTDGADRWRGSRAGCSMVTRDVPVVGGNVDGKRQTPEGATSRRPRGQHARHADRLRSAGLSTVGARERFHGE